MNRRLFLKTLFLASFTSIFPLSSFSRQQKILFKKIPSTGQNISTIGMGTWQTFDIGYNTKELNKRVKILNTFFRYGGQLIDSSPMYGTSERVLGKSLNQVNDSQNLFSATKVWTPYKWHGLKQLETSKNYWKVSTFDLLQVHNLVNYEEHLETLIKLKNSNLVKYIGVTTSHGIRHKKIEYIMKKYDLDFIQLTYNIIDRDAEKYLLPLAKERGIAVIANRPFQGGSLFKNIKNKSLSSTAIELGIKNWADYLLKFITGHPSVTCAIPATSQIMHMKENMKALSGRLPSRKERTRLAQEFINF